MKHWLIEMLIYLLTLVFVAVSCYGLTRVYGGCFEDVWEDSEE